MNYSKTTESQFLPLSRRREGANVFDRFQTHNNDNRFFSSGDVVGRHLVDGDSQAPYRTVPGAQSLSVAFSRSETRIKPGNEPNSLERRRRPRSRRR